MGVQRILIVDDDASVRRLLRRCLETEGYQVDEAADRAALLRAIRGHAYDLITLDIGLGTDSGLSLIAEIRATANTAVVMISGKGDMVDRVVGLEMGADDYISKPFHVREVQARIRAVLRRKGASAPPSGNPPVGGRLAFDGWVADPIGFQLVDPDGNPCELTTTEFQLLAVLMQNPRRVLSRDRLMDLTKGADWTPLDRTIDNQIARLRKKIEEDPANPVKIKTVRGVGYIFTPDVSPI